MRRWLIRIAVLAVLVAAGFALRATVLRPDPVEVSAASLSKGRVEETVTNTRAGTVKARRRAQLAPEVGGRVVFIARREGDRVESGEVLMRLDASVTEAQVSLSRREQQAAEAQRQQACLAAERARRELGRISRLAKEGIVSADLLDQAQTSAETSEASCRAARAAVDQARAAVELSSRRVDQLVIRAPFDGIVADLSVSVSERTKEGGAAMLSLSDGLLGLATGWLAVRVLVRAFPALPASPPAWVVIAALTLSMATGIVFGLLPARRAAKLDPVAALAGK